MKIPLKYGLAVAAGLMAWVLIAHNVVSNPKSPVHTLVGPIFFNVLQFAMIYLGVKALEHQKRDRPTFKEGLKTGVAISFVYGLAGSLFFAGALAVVGPKWMANEPGAAGTPMWVGILVAFLLFFFGVQFLGLFYSAVISFFLAKRQSEDD
jgi:hypothetical protein